MSERRLWAAAGAALLAAVAVLVVALATTRSPAPRPPPPRSTPRSTPPVPTPAAGVRFGVNVNHLFNDAVYSAAQIDSELAALRATGVTLARTDALWERAEPTAPVAGVHRYDWAFDDAIAGSLAAHRLAWLPILDYSAPWAQSVAGQDHSPPSSDGDYAGYARAFAARYGAGGSFWRAHPELPADPVTTIEIWNEPDNGEFWTPAPNAGAYAALYLAARAAIDDVDPSARVIIGGLTDAPRFLRALVDARPGLRGEVDGVAIHPYGAPDVVLARVRSARATLDALGMRAVPLYATEVGWTTTDPRSPAYASPAARPADIRRTLAALGHLGCGLRAVVLYTWVGPDDGYALHDPVGDAALTAGLRAAGRPAAGAARGC